MDHKKNSLNFRKQRLRGTMSMIASYTEIYVAVLILIGIILLSASELRYLGLIVQDIINGTQTIQITTFLSTAFELVIGIEFIKMLAKHTPSSAVEVLLFAIARQLISTTHGNMLDALIGVIAIAILFAIRKYLSETIHHSKENEYIVNGSITVDDLNNKIGSNINLVLGNTIAGVLFNNSSRENVTIKPGYSMKIDDYFFQVYSMDEGLIKQVKIETDTI